MGIIRMGRLLVGWLLGGGSFFRVLIVYFAFVLETYQHMVRVGGKQVLRATRLRAIRGGGGREGGGWESRY